MTEQELEQQRAANWRIDGNAVHTVEEARNFVEAVGFCLMYPERTLPRVASFMGAFAGTAAGLPLAKNAYADPRAQQATDLMVRLLRERSAFEMILSGENTLVVSAAAFPFFYGLVGDRTPKALPQKKAQGAAVSELSAKVFEALQKHGPLSKTQLQEHVGRESSQAALDRALTRAMVDPEDYAGGLQRARRRFLGRAVSLGAGAGKRRHQYFRAGSCYGAGEQIS